MKPHSSPIVYVLLAVAFVATAVVFPGVALAGDQECEIPQESGLLIKGSCEPGSPIKFKLAGPPEAKFRLHVEYSVEPLPVPGTYVFCPPITPDIPVIASGRLNALGFRSIWWNLPEDPELIGHRLRFWFITLNQPGDGALTLSNPVETEICDPELGGGPCEGGLRRLGYFIVLRYSGEFPVDVATRAYRRGSPSELVGEIELSFDPTTPPILPMIDETDVGELVLTEIASYPGVVVLHCVVKGCGYANGRLPNETTFEVELDGEVISRDLHTSCSVPVYPGLRLKPFILSYVQDVRSAPDGDCPSSMLVLEGSSPLSR